MADPAIEVATEVARWVSVREPNQCWPCSRGDSVGIGYRRIWVSGRRIRAHRYIYEIVNGPIPDGESICHTCDNPSCCNPSHLFSAPHSVNMADKMAKGRHFAQNGQRSGTSKLSDDDAYEVRLLARMGMNQRILGLQYGISQPNVSALKNGKTWGWQEKRA